MRTFIMALAATAMLGGSAVAQTATTKTIAKAPGQPTKTTVTHGSPPKAARTEASLACSAQADSKGLHKKDREKFMRSCKKGGKSNG